jgi:hypothetical protein
MTSMYWNKYPLRIFLFALLPLLLAVTCDREPMQTLKDADEKMNRVRGRLTLGEVQGVTFGPFKKADWFVIIPANSTPEMFDADSPFMKEAASALNELVGFEVPIMALVAKGKVLEFQELVPPFDTETVQTRRGHLVAGIRFGRNHESTRAYKIMKID